MHLMGHRVTVLPGMPDRKRPSQVNGELPQEVDEIILKAMAKSKDERYDAVVLFRNALQNVI